MWRIQLFVCILLYWQLTYFKLVRSCLKERTCMQETSNSDVSRDAELIVNCNMNYPTIKVNQLNKDSTELLQVEYVCKNITTQDEKKSCILASNNLQNLDDKVYNFTIPHGTFCLIRGCIQDGFNKYYLETNDIRCDRYSITGPSSNTQISYLSTNPYQTITSTLQYITSGTELHSTNSIFILKESSSISLKEQTSIVISSQVPLHTSNNGLLSLSMISFTSLKEQTSIIISSQIPLHTGSIGLSSLSMTSSTSLKEQTSIITSSQVALRTSSNRLSSLSMTSYTSLKDMTSMNLFTPSPNNNGNSLIFSGATFIISILVAFIFTIVMCFGAIAVYQVVFKRKKKYKEDYILTSSFTHYSITLNVDKMKAEAFESSLSIITLYSPLYYSDQEEVSHNTNTVMTIEHAPDVVCTSNQQSYSNPVVISPVNSAAMPKKAFSHQSSTDQTVDESSYIEYEEADLTSTDKSKHSISSDLENISIGLLHAHNLDNITISSASFPFRRHSLSKLSAISPDQHEQDFSLKSIGDDKTNLLVPFRRYSLPLPSLSAQYEQPMEQSIIDLHLLHPSSYNYHKIIASDGSLDYELRSEDKDTTWHTQNSEGYTATFDYTEQYTKRNLLPHDKRIYSHTGKYNSLDDITYIDTDNKYW